MTNLFNEIWRIAGENPEGFTIQLEDLQPVKAGFAIGHSETQNSFGKSGLRKVIIHSLKTTKVLGGWMHNGRYYFDTVIIVHDKQTALKLKADHDQIAIYWIEEGQVL